LYVWSEWGKKKGRGTCHCIFLGSALILYIMHF